ncbi:hypothetical protein NOF04DRAFT_1205004 [Fusarium oxysporum II5]|nr:hypothetical protein NOF04DRAFT_1205004 [Fusarium oxysporum II5]
MGYCTSQTPTSSTSMTLKIMWKYQNASPEGSPNRLFVMDRLLPKTQDNDLRGPQQGPQNEATVAKKEGTQSKCFLMTESSRLRFSLVCSLLFSFSSSFIHICISSVLTNPSICCLKSLNQSQKPALNYRHYLPEANPSFKNMVSVKLAAIGALLATAQAQIRHPNEDLVLADCGIGDNKAHPGWSTSRQVNWYQDIQWPDDVSKFPPPPDLEVEVPYADGTYPWNPKGTTVKLSNGVVWTAYINPRIADGQPAGSAVTTKEGGQELTCYAYRGRPVSAAINTTVNADAVCLTAFVCNRDNRAPPRPSGMENPTSTLETSPAPPATTTFVSQPPATPSPTGGEPNPPADPNAGKLFVSILLSPRFINWPNTWQAFIEKFSWDRDSGKCVTEPVKGDGYTINIDCAGIQIDSDSHMTLIMIKILHDIGMSSTFFNQNPTVPGKRNSTADHWMVMPESFSLQAIDVSHQKTIGYLAYNTTYNNFLAGPCSSCQSERFNKDFFDPALEAVKGTYPLYNSYNIQAQCSPWMACW